MPNVLIANADFVGVPQDLAEAFVVASNGSFHIQRIALDERPFLEMTTRAGAGFEAEGMEPYRASEGLVLHAPKIARQSLEEVESFFRAVYDSHHSEAIVLLYHTPAQGGLWRFVAPEQTVTGGHCDWTSPGPAPTGWFLAGSFHSHGRMGAFHSGTDDHDEMSWNGVHVTVGKIDSPRPEYACSVVFGGKRHRVELEDLVAPSMPVSFPEGWLGQVRKYVPPPATLIGRTPTHRGGRSAHKSRFQGGRHEE